MNEVDIIAFLSDKGYESINSGKYLIAEQYFTEAVHHATRLVENGNLELKQDLNYIINSLRNMAQEANQKHTHYQDNTSAKITLEIVEKINSANKNSVRNKQKIQKTVSPSKQMKKINGSTTKTRINLPIGVIPATKDTIFWKPESLMNGIMTITGGSGSGKTETLKSLAKMLMENSIPCVILDLHGDIDLEIPTISLDYLGEHGVNPLELSSKSEKEGGPLPHINHLMNQFSYAMKDRFSPTQNAWLRNLLKFSYFTHGIIQDDASTWKNQPPDYKYLLKLIQFPDEKILASQREEFIRLLDTITYSTKAAVENRLSPILEHPAFSGKKGIPIDHITKESIRILLKPLNTIDMQFIAADTILKQVFSYLKSLGHVSSAEKFRLFVLIDEAKILTGFKGKLNDPFHILNRFATEARKFGLGLILASQIFSHFGRDIKSNTATKLILRTMDLEETKHCSRELKIDLMTLSNLSKPGEGYIITSENPQAQHIQLFPCK